MIPLIRLNNFKQLFNKLRKPIVKQTNWINPPLTYKVYQTLKYLDLRFNPEILDRFGSGSSSNENRVRSKRPD